MTAWAIWLVLAGVLIAAELFIGTFYLLMLALGLVAGGIAALLQVSLEWQLLIAAVVGIGATIALRRSGFGRRRVRQATSDPNVILDIGQSLHVDQWQAQGDVYIARVKYRGAMWDVELVPGISALPGQYVIREVRGSRLIVAP
ncbi:NfeD family protein [Herbaspirillum lusitanum]|uniref:NfeD family protein n=1 Tax=Herbaspirillum lusitanum TaxID=213312 RepID=A0ABW9A8Q0_9BURK